MSIISRSEERLAQFAAEIPHTVPYQADLSDTQGYRATLERIVAERGVPKVVIHNATITSRIYIYFDFVLRNITK